ncbi:MAG: divalent-cation tolerance protein CutA [Nitrospirota bacterium]
MDAIVVLITAPSKKEAEEISNALIETKLIACANVLSGIHSIFSWQGTICSEEETLLILKTKKALFVPICEAVKKMHSYRVPEIIALPIVEGSSEYLQWLDENTK